jgi:tetratricopeptide (TPR) repeat protein
VARWVGEKRKNPPGVVPYQPQFAKKYYTASVDFKFLIMNIWKLGCVTCLSLASIFSTAHASQGEQIPSPSQAFALEQQGKLAAAEDAWRQITRANPQDATAFASLGLVLSRQGKYQKAVGAYSKAAALNPTLPGLQLNWGLAEFKQEHFEPAIAPLSAALAADPQNMQARTLLGLSCYGAKRFAEAAKHLTPAAKADPTNTELHRVLAQSCLSAKEYSCALAEFRHILEHDPDSAAAHMLSGEALDGLGRTVEAIPEFEAAAKAAPREPNVHFGLGYLYWKMHKYDEAQTAFKAELSIDPGHAQSLAYLGDIELKKNAPDKALRLLQKAAQMRNDIRIAYLDIGAILLDQKNYPEALAALRRAERLDPTLPDAHYRLARLYRAMGNATAAEREFAKVNELQDKAEDMAPKMGPPPSPLPD